MLKTKLVKAGFFGHGALFIMISPYGVSLKGEAKPYQTPLVETTISVQKDLHQQLLKDTGIIQPSDSVSAETEETSVEVPKISMNATAAKYVKQFLKKNMED